MAIDRGGLQYTITVDGNFAASLTQFKSELRAAQAAWEGFRNSISKGVGVGKIKSEIEGAAKSAERAAAGAKKIKPEPAAKKEFDAIEAAMRRIVALEQRYLTLLESEKIINQNRQSGSGKQISDLRARARFQESANRSQERAAEAAQRLSDLQSDDIARAIAQADISTRLFNRRVQQFREQEAAAKGYVAVGKEILTIEEAQARAAAKAPRPGQAAFVGPLQQSAAQLKAQRPQLSPQDTARQRLQQELLSLEVEKEFVALKKASPEYARLTDQLRALGETKTTLADRINRVSFTFRRLFGILAAFTIAREAVNGFVGSIRGALQASSEFEQAQLGIATILASVAEIYDANGNRLQRGAQEAERFAAAQQVSIQVFNQLRAASQTSAASFNELIDGFRIAAGVTLGAGFSLQQTVEFVTNIGRAARVAGVGANQLAEEIRSIVLGTISIRNTKIATVLKIRNEDVRKAREANNLVGLLQEKFAAFETAAPAITQSFASEAQNTADAIRFLLSDSSTAFTETIKQAIVDLRSNIEVIQKGEGGLPEITTAPGAAKALEPLFKSLAVSAEAIRLAFASISADELATTFSFFGEIISSVIRGLASVSTFVFKAIQPSLKLLTRLVQVVQNLFSAYSALRAVVNNFTGGWLDKITLIVVQFAGAIATAVVLRQALAAIKGLKVFSNLISGAKLFAAALDKVFAATKLVFSGLKNIRGATIKWLIAVLVVLGTFLVLAEVFGVLESILNKVTDVVAPFVEQLDKLEQGILKRLEKKKILDLNFEADLVAFNEEINNQLNDLDEDISAKIVDINEKARIEIKTSAFEGAEANAILEPLIKINEERSKEQRALERSRGILQETIESNQQALRDVEDNIQKLKQKGSTEEQINALLSRRRSILANTDILSEQQKLIDEDILRLKNQLIQAESERLAIQVRFRLESLREQTAVAALARFQAARRADLAGTGNLESIQAFEELADIDKKRLDLQILQKNNLKELNALEATRQLLAASGLQGGALDLAIQEQITRQKRLATAKESELLAIISAAENIRKERLRREAQEIGAASQILALENDRVSRQIEFTNQRILSANASKEEIQVIEEQQQLELDAIDSKKEQLQIQEEISSARRELQGILEKDEASDARRTELINRIALLTDKATLAEEASGRIAAEKRAALDRRIALLREELRIQTSILELEEQSARISRRFDIQAQTASAREDLFLAQNQLGLTQQQVDLLRQTLAVRQAQRQIDRAEAESAVQVNLLLEQRKLLQLDSANNLDQIRKLDADIVDAQERGSSNINEANLRYQEQVALLENIKFLQTFGGGAFTAAKAFAEQNSAAALGSSVVQSSLTGLQGFATTALSGAIADAFDPNVNFDLQEAFAQFTLQLGQQILDAVVGNLIASLLSSLGLLSPLPPAFTVAATALGAAAVPLEAAATKLLLAAIFLKGANVMSGGIVVPAAAQGGFVQSFARGGRARHPFSRPDGLDHRDRVPVWTRPGEWIIRPEAVQKYGSSLFAALNSRRLNPDAVRGIAATTSPVKTAVVDKPGFATGGMVRTGATGAMSGSTSMTLVQPIMLNDEQTMDQALAAGPKALLRFAKTNRNDMRAALGMPRRGT